MMISCLRIGRTSLSCSCALRTSHGVQNFLLLVFFFFQQKTAYDMRISDWSSDVCSSDLATVESLVAAAAGDHRPAIPAYKDLAAYEGDGGYKLLRACQIGRASCRERVCQ